MRVKVCKNCRYWDQQGLTELTAGICIRNSIHRTGFDTQGIQRDSVDLVRTTDLQTCSAFTYKADADEYPDVRKGGFGSGGDGGEPPVDITPKGPKGGYLLQIAAEPMATHTAWPAAGGAVYVTHDTDKDKSD